MPEAMTRLVWVVPRDRLGPALERLAGTEAFQPIDRRTLGEAQDLGPLQRALRADRQRALQERARRILARLPDNPLLHYQIGLQSGTAPLPAGAIPLDDQCFLQVAPNPQDPPAPPVPPTVDGAAPTLSADQQRLLFATGDRVGRVGEWAIIDGWLPSRQAPHFRTWLKDEPATLTPAAETGLPAERVPSLFHRPSPLQGFAALMGLYGVTGYREIDPTPLLTLSFTLLFGMMFADLGQGGLLFLLGLGLYRGPGDRGRSGRRQAGLLLMPVGLSAALFGLLFGNLFAREDWITPLIHHPLDQVFPSLAISVLIGVGLLCLGMALGLLNAWLGGRLQARLWDNYGPIGLLFYLGLVGCLLGGWAHWPALLYPGAALALAALGAMAVGYYRRLGGEPPGLRLFQALIETYDFAVKFVVQTLSFVRLAAFTFAHIALSMALVVIVDLFAGHPWLAWLSWPAFVLGNLLITVVEGVLVAIQVIRLHFFELFTKFTAAGGVPFEPLRLPGDT